MPRQLILAAPAEADDLVLTKRGCTPCALSAVAKTRGFRSIRGSRPSRCAQGMSWSARRTRPRRTSARGRVEAPSRTGRLGAIGDVNRDLGGTVQPDEV